MSKWFSRDGINICSKRMPVHYGKSSSQNVFSARNKINDILYKTQLDVTLVKRRTFCRYLGLVPTSAWRKKKFRSIARYIRACLFVPIMLHLIIIYRLIFSKYRLRKASHFFNRSKITIIKKYVKSSAKETAQLV